MKQIFFALLCIVSFLTITFCSINAPAEAEDQHPSLLKNNSAEFDRLKGLVGDWKGTGSDEKEKDLEVQYKLSSGGTTIIETLFPGKPHEMVSVYYTDGKNLRMTHFCALGNQPVMELKKTSPTEMDFSYIPTRGIEPKKDRHMHSLKIIFLTPDKMEARWVSFDKGKAETETVLKFDRVS